MTAVATCPQCQLQLSVPDEANADSLVKCPVCRSTFELRSVQLAPMLEMIVVPVPSQPLTAPANRDVDELVAPLPLAPQSESPLEPVDEDDLALQDEPADENSVLTATPDEAVLDLDEALPPAENTEFSSDSDTQAPDEASYEPGETENAEEDNTPLENPEPTEIDDGLHDELPGHPSHGASEQAADAAPEQYAPTVAEQLSGWTDDQYLADTPTSPEPSAENPFVDDQLQTEPLAAHESPTDEDALELQTESLELEQHEPVAPSSASETVEDVPLTGALPAGVQPLFSSVTQPEPSPADGPPAFAEPHVEQEVLASEIERLQESVAHDEARSVNEFTELPPAEPAETSWPKSDAAEEAEQDPPLHVSEQYEPAPPIGLGSWQFGEQPQSEAPSESVETPPIEPATVTRDVASDDGGEEAIGWPLPQPPLHSETESADPPTEISHSDVTVADVASAREAGLDETSLEATVDEFQPPDSESLSESLQNESSQQMADERREESPDEHSSPAGTDRQRSTQIPLPGFDRSGQSAEQSWFRSWMVLAALVIGGVGAAGFGIWSLLSSGQASPALASTDEGAGTAPSTAEVNSRTERNPAESNPVLASYEATVESPNVVENNETEPLSMPTEPGVFRQPVAQPLNSTAHVVDAPSYSFDDVAQALEVAQQVEQNLVEGTMTAKEKADSFVYFCDLAEKLTYMSDDGGSYLVKLDAKDIFRRVLVDREVRREVTQLAALWMDSPTRRESGVNGIVLGGKLSDMRYRGGAFEYWVNGESGETFRFVVPEILDQKLFREGEAVVVAGAIVEHPEQAIAGYRNGDSERVIWASVVKLLDRPNDAPKDRRLSIFQDP